MEFTWKLLKVPILLFTFVTLCACDSGGSFGDYSNYELSKEHQACQTPNLSPAGAQRCNNIERECKKRKKESAYRC
ncbi:MAG: hypothetical protein IPM37_21440 [Hahellaceae bacterium]|nr:hypothetical protein [Hahellaceae bacterium]